MHWNYSKATKATLKKRALLPGTNSYFLTCWSILLVHLLWCFVGSCLIVVLHHLCVWAPCMFWVLFSLIHVLWGPGYCLNWLGMHAALSLWLGLAWPWCMCALNIIHVIVILGWKLGFLFPPTTLWLTRFCNLMQLCWLDACGLHLSQCLCLTLSGRWICASYIE